VGVVVVRRALVTGVVVVMHMRAAVQFAGGMAMLALLGAVPMRVRMGMRMVVAVCMRVGVRVVQITVGVGGLLVRHGGTLDGGRQGQ